MFQVSGFSCVLFQRYAFCTLQSLHSLTHLSAINKEGDAIFGSLFRPTLSSHYSLVVIRADKAFSICIILVYDIFYHTFSPHVVCEGSCCCKFTTFDVLLLALTVIWNEEPQENFSSYSVGRKGTFYDR